MLAVVGGTGEDGEPNAPSVAAAHSLGLRIGELSEEINGVRPDRLPLVGTIQRVKAVLGSALASIRDSI